MAVHYGLDQNGDALQQLAAVFCIQHVSHVVDSVDARCHFVRIVWVFERTSEHWAVMAVAKICAFFLLTKKESVLEGFLKLLFYSVEASWTNKARRVLFTACISFNMYLSHLLPILKH
jgi:hypothetical protein